MELLLDDWQKEIIKHKGNSLLCTGRQVGKTTTFAIKAAEYMLSNPASQIIIVSLTEDQAKLIIAMILNYLDRHYKTQIARGKHKPTQSTITLKNKAKAISRPVGNTGDAVRGFTGDVLIIDEASRMPALMWAAAKPTLLTTAGEIWMCSTPAGKEGYFWEAFQNKANRYKVWHKSSEEVINQRQISDSWTEKQRAEAINFLKVEREDMSQLQYGQEYLGLFLEDLQRFYSDELLAKCCVLKREEPNASGEYYMGVDIARLGGDESAYQILQVLGDKIRQAESIAESRKLTTHTEARILELNKTWKLKKIGVDAGSGSLGVGIYDHLLAHPDTKRKVIAMNNRQISLDREGKKRQRIFKEDMHDNLRSMMEHGEILFLDDDKLLASFRSVQFEFVKDMQKKAITKVRIFGRYTHIVEGLIRAAWLAKKEKSKKFFIDYI